MFQVPIHGIWHIGQVNGPFWKSEWILVAFGNNCMSKDLHTCQEKIQYSYSVLLFCFCCWRSYLVPRIASYSLCTQASITLLAIPLPQLLEYLDCRHIHQASSGFLRNTKSIWYNTHRFHSSLHPHPPDAWNQMAKLSNVTYVLTSTS